MPARKVSLAQQAARMRQTGQRAARQTARVARATPAAVHGEVRRNPGHLLAAGALVGGAGIQARPLERRRNDAQRRRADAATGAAVGGVLGNAAFLGTGYRIKHLGHQRERWNPEFPNPHDPKRSHGPHNMTRSQHNKLMRDHNREYGVKGNTRPNPSQQPAYFRNYPEGLPATKYKHLLGHMSGRKGRAIQASVSGGAAMIGAASTAGVNRARDRRKSVSKVLYQREERLSILRTGELAAGLGLAAWGAGRSPMIGAALARGVKAASTKDADAAVRALQLAQAAQGTLRRGTASSERHLRQIQSVDRAVRAVPSAIRPEVATAAGLLLAGHAVPIRNTSYRPVTTPVRVHGVNW